MENQDKQIKRLLEYFKNFQFTDLLGFANILQVQEQDNFIDFVTDICDAFSKQPKGKRKELLKLAKDVSQANLSDKKRKKEKN